MYKPRSNSGPAIFGYFTPGAVLALSIRNFKSRMAMLWELVTNGVAACLQVKRPVQVDIRLWGAGEHPLKGRVITVTDQGIGFTPEVIQAYSMIGQSVHEGDISTPGKHGTGKLGAFGLVEDVEKDPTKARFLILTRPTARGPVLQFEMNIEDLIDPTKGVHASEVPVDRYPDLPKSGSFSQILIPNAAQVDPQELVDFISANLQQKEWKVTVNGKKVPMFTFTPEVALETEEPILALGNQVVVMEFARLKEGPTHPAHTVRLIDFDSGRVVGDIDGVPRRAVRDNGLRILCTPGLVGKVYVAGLEDHSTGARDGLTAAFWGGPAGQALCLALQLYAVPALQELFGEEPSESGLLGASLGSVLKSFTDAFGTPQVPGVTVLTEGPGTSAETTANPEGTKEAAEKKPKSDKPRRERKPRPPRPTDTDATLVVIDGTTYEVLTQPMGGKNVPGQVFGKGAYNVQVIVIDTEHPAIATLVTARKGGKVSMGLARERLVRALVEAHVAHTVSDSTGAFTAAYELISKLEAGTTA